MIVRVKYCGGCNPRYDREAFLKRLADVFPEIEFRTEMSGNPSAGMVICGCDTACADAAGCIGNSGRIVVWKESAFETACRFLQEILQDHKKES